MRLQETAPSEQEAPYESVVGREAETPSGQEAPSELVLLAAQ